MYQYFVKVVPTVYNKLTGQVCDTVTMVPSHTVTMIPYYNVCNPDVVRLSRPINSLLLGTRKLQML